MRRVLLPIGTLTARQLSGADPLVSGSGCLTWHSTHEASGSAAASYSLVDGAAGNGQQLAYVALSAGESTRDFIGLHALPFLESLTLVVESGALGGTFTAWVDHLCDEYLHVEHLALEALLVSLAPPVGG